MRSSSRASLAWRSVTVSSPPSSAAKSVARRSSSLIKEALAPSVRALRARDDQARVAEAQVEAFAVERDQAPPTGRVLCLQPPRGLLQKGAKGLPEGGGGVLVYLDLLVARARRRESLESTVILLRLTRC